MFSPKKGLKGKEKTATRRPKEYFNTFLTKKRKNNRYRLRR